MSLPAGTGGRPATYRAMGFLLEVHDETRSEIIRSVKKVFNLDVGQIYVYTTSHQYRFRNRAQTRL